MTVRTKLARQLGAAVAATALLLLLVLAWDLRPALPPMPQSLSQPLPGRAISAVLDLAAWTVAVLLDLVVVVRVVQFALRKTPSRTELRLHRAFAGRERPPITRRNWRVHAAPLAPPVLRLPASNEPEPQSLSGDVPQGDLHMPLTPVEATRDDGDDGPACCFSGRSSSPAARKNSHDGRQQPNSSPSSRRKAVPLAATSFSKPSGQATIPAAAQRASTRR